MTHLGMRNLNLQLPRETAAAQVDAEMNADPSQNETFPFEFS